jgi:hypothetical protein
VARFVQLIGKTDESVYVNPDSISGFEPHEIDGQVEPATKIVFVNGDNVVVKAPPAVVYNLLSE